MNPTLPDPDIVFQCDQILAVNKPGGLLTQAPSGIDSIELRIKQYLRRLRADTSQQKTYLGVPHRLDRPASGVMIFAKEKPAARYLADRFQRREVRKLYWAVLQGSLEIDESTWSDFMRKLPDEAKSEIVADDHPDSQLAVLHYRVIQRHEDCTLVEIRLETGRSHQIRLQSSSRGSPILGDDLYGSARTFGPQAQDQRLRTIALHARRLEVRHPKTGELLTLVARLPESWEELGFDIDDSH